MTLRAVEEWVDSAVLVWDADTCLFCRWFIECDRSRAGGSRIFLEDVDTVE